MIAKLVFKIPRDNEGFKLAIKASEMYSIICDVMDYRRHLYKHEEKNYFNKQEIIDKLDELLDGFEL